MKNAFLSHLSFFDQIYPVIARLPRFLRTQIACCIPFYLNNSLKKRGLPDRLTVFVTDRCNLRCRHCFISTAEREAGWEMGLKEYEMFFRKAKGIFSQVLFTGGEPTIRDDFGDILILAARYGAVGSATVFTNGTFYNRLRKSIEQTIKESPMRLSFQISIDGTEIFHDANRQVKGAFSNALETMAFLRSLKSRYPKRISRLVAATAISKDNLHELPAIIDIVRKTKFSHVFTFVRSSKMHVFNIADHRDVSDFAPVAFDSYLTVKEMEEALKILCEYLWSCEPSRLLYATNHVILKTIMERLKTKIPKTLCYSGLADVVILPNGDVAPCEMLRSCTNLREFDWDIASLIRSCVYKDCFKKTRGCWCTHDCSIGLSIMYDKKLINDLFSKCKVE